MLDPEYLLRITEGAEQIAEELHTEIVNRIVQRIMIRLGRGETYLLTAQDKWQLEVLRDAGFLMEDVQREISRRTKVQLQELKEAFEDAAVQNLAYDHSIYQAAGLSPTPLMQSPDLIRLVQRGYEATAQEWRNFTRTTANAAHQTFIRECDRAYTLAASGSMSYSQIVREAVERISSDGVKVTYPSGHVDTIETATLRAVRTGISQACADITDTRMDEMEWDIILTSAHIGARDTGKNDHTDHVWWQGRFFSKSGKDDRFPPFSVCGPGDVQGIHGANCRHSHGPGDGVHNPYENIDREENKKAYELSQRQRALERRIRKTKREVQGLKTALDNADPSVKPEIQAAYQKKAELLRKQNAAYNKFCEENDLKRLSDRVSISKWDRKQAAQARGAASRKEKVAKSPKDGIMEKNSEGMTTDVQPIAELDITKYAAVADGKIRSGTVVLTDNQAKHIIHRRGKAFFDKYERHFKTIVEDPDYIFKDPKHPNTALVTKTLLLDGEHVNLVIRLAVEGDDPELENSIITAILENQKRYEQRLRNNTPLYKRE